MVAWCTLLVLAVSVQVTGLDSEYPTEDPDATLNESLSEQIPPMRQPGKVLLLMGARFVSGAIDGLPGLVLGLVCAALLAGFVGDARLRRLGGSGTNADDLLRVALLAKLLPLDLFGALPVGVVLVRARMPAAAVVTCLLSAPLMNLATIALAFSRLPAATVFFLCIPALIVPILAGLAVARFAARGVSDDELSVADVPALGWRRALQVATETARGPVLVDLAVGLALCSAMTVVVSSPQFADLLSGRQWLRLGLLFAPLAMTQEQALGAAHAVLRSGEMSGAAYLIVILGGAFFVGTLSWLQRNCGVRVMAITLVCVIPLAIASGFAYELVLSEGLGGTRATRAFDALTRPAGALSLQQVATETLRTGMARLIGVNGAALVGLLALLMAGDVLQRVLPARGDRQAEWPIRVRSPQAVAFGLAMAYACICTYLYFPSPAVTYERLDRAVSEACSALSVGDLPRARYQLGETEQLAAKLTLGAVLRGRSAVEPSANSAGLRAWAQEARVALASEQRSMAWELLEAARGQIPVEYQATIPSGDSSP